MARKKFETDAGRAFSEETSGISRSLAASKAAMTRRRMQHQEREQYRSGHYLASCRNRDDEYYGSWPVGDMTLAEAVADVIGAMESTRSEYGLEEDVAIWLNRRLVAVVRWGPEGKPVPTIF